MAKQRHAVPILLAVLVAFSLLVTGSTASAKAKAKKKSTTSFDIARVFFEYNSSGNDLGVHVFLDGEDWKRLRIVNPNGRTIFEVEGKGPYRELGLTELFFEGAEPNLGDVPLEELLEQFPAGEYRLIGRTVDNEHELGVIPRRRAAVGVAGTRGEDGALTGNPRRRPAVGRRRQADAG